MKNIKNCPCEYSIKQAKMHGSLKIYFAMAAMLEKKNDMQEQELSVSA
jgi:hypothetical protein